MSSILGVCRRTSQLRMWARSLGALALVLVTSLLPATLRAAEDSVIPFPASVDWLAARLEDPSLVVLHIGEKAEYESGHIPGARFISRQDISTPAGSLPVLEMPPTAQLQEAFESAGISDKSFVVVCFGNDWVTPSARVVLTLQYFGLGKRATLLDGGLAAWRASGKPTTSEVKAVSRGHLTPGVRNDIIVDLAWVKDHLGRSDVALVDSRTPNFFSGESAGTAARAGHIPGARNIPFGTIVDNALKLKDRGALEAVFKAAGVGPGQTVVTYCHIGQQASLVYLAARLLGYEARMYDGSFTEWASRPELPVEKN